MKESCLNCKNRKVKQNVKFKKIDHRCSKHNNSILDGRILQNVQCNNASGNQFEPYEVIDFCSDIELSSSDKRLI